MMHDEEQNLDGSGQPSQVAAEALPGGHAPAVEELLAAPLATLTATPTSAEGRDFIVRVVDTIAEHEKATGRRQRARRTADQKSFSRAVGGLLGDLLAHTPRGGRGALVYRSLNNNSFTGGPVAYRQFQAAWEALVELRLIERIPGYYEAKKFDWGNGQVNGFGKASRFRATPKLLAMAADHGITAGATRSHFRRGTDEQVIVLKSKSMRQGGSKVKGHLMKVFPSPEVERLADQVRLIDAFLAEVEITGGSHEGFYRQFEHGDDPEFEWNKGGRLYSRGDGNYQTLKEADRLLMRFDGEPVVEIDLKASYLTILHGKLGVVPQFGDDPYGAEGPRRWVTKTWLVATLGAGKHLQRWPRDRATQYAERFRGRLGRDHPVTEVGERLLARYPILRRIGEPGLGWADLMFIESEVILRTMLSLIDHRVPSLPIHDSLLVPAQAEQLSIDLLKETFEEVVGVSPMLDVSRGGTG